MLDLIFLSPLLLLIVVALAIRFRILRRPFQATGWAILTLGVAVSFYLPLCLGVWLPDVLFAPHRTLAATTSPTGYAFRVVQYWNRVDFYSTQLHVTPPNAPAKVFTLEGDDSKSWTVPLSVNEGNRMASITLSGGRTKNIQW